MRSREEHLEWCKQRARDYLKAGDIPNAITSMLSDLGKHPDTRLDDPFLPMVGMLAARDNDLAAAERFIEGFR